MSKRLLSVGLDVGTTSTQMVVSRLTIENRASSFAVPELEISDREVIYKSPVYFTPLSGEDRIDGAALRALIAGEYASAGISRESVDTGAIIVTGETSRKENAAEISQALSDFAGDFVVAAAGPDLESVLAAKGSGAVAYSRETGKTVLHMDIGGGTANLALIRDGEITATGCLNVGGRLIRLDSGGRITYISPVLSPICDLRIGDVVTDRQLSPVVWLLVQALEMAAGRLPPTELLETLWTKECTAPWQIPSVDAVISFSGGVADCMAQVFPTLQFGDIGPLLGQAISHSSLCFGEYVLGKQTIRATVIGAGSYSTQLSGSTIFFQNISFPLKNLPVVTSQDSWDADSILSLPGINAPSYGKIVEMAQELANRHPPGPVVLCLQQDMAKALGQALSLRLPKNTPIACLDRVKVSQGSYLDIGSPVGQAIPVVVKTLVLEPQSMR